MLLLVDLDGVVYRGSEPVPGVAAVLAARAAAGDTVVYVTNNSMHYRADYVTRLSAMGAPVAPDRIVSSARATALYIAGLGPAEGGPIRRVLTVGAPGLERECRDVGLEVVPSGEAAELLAAGAADGLTAWDVAGHPDAVVCGLDQRFDYGRLRVAVACIRRGARFIATNRDPIYPTERDTQPGAGAIVAAVEAGSQVTPISIGKPGTLLLEMAARTAGVPVTDAVMIGDGLATDLRAANAVGIPCVFMLTGVTTRAEIEALPAAERPIALAADAAELAAALRALGTLAVSATSAAATTKATSATASATASAAPRAS